MRTENVKSSDCLKKTLNLTLMILTLLFITFMYIFFPLLTCQFSVETTHTDGRVEKCCPLQALMNSLS